MADTTSIWSGAFAAMAGAPLRSRNDRAAGPIRAVWDSVRIACILEEQWPWTIKRSAAALSKEEAPSHPEKYRFTLPDDMAGSGPIALYNAADSYEAITGWRQQGLYAFADDDTLWADYQYDAPVERWPEQFAEWVRLRICEETAFSYTGSESRVESFRRRAEKQFSSLINAVLQTSPPTVLIDRFQTTSARAGFGLAPIHLRADDDGVLRAI